jgi:hypothetical protein
MPQLLYSTLLLDQERSAVEDGRAFLDAVEGVLGLQMREMGRADHDLRGHAADIDAGPP